MKKLKLSLVQLFFTFLAFGQPLEITMEDYTAIPTEHFCLEFQVNNFNQIVSSQYSILWDETVLSFDSLTNVGLPLPNNLFTNTAFVNTGVLLVNWFDPMGNGHDLSDNSVIYELCFTAIGSVGSSTILEISDLPLEIEVISTLNGEEDIGIDYSGGNVSIVAPLVLSSFNLSQPDCMNPDVGSIELVPAGGLAPYTFSWEGPGGFAETTEDIFNLSTGTYFLTITDNSNPPIKYLDTFEINATLSLPTVIIDQDAIITCTDSILTLDATGSSDGVGFEILWITSNGNILSNENTLNPIIDMAGDYQLIITNTDNNCTATASVTVEEDVEIPSALGGEDGLIDCIDIVSILDGSVSSSGSDFSAFWTTIDGNILTGENTFTATVNASGTYELTVLNETNGCFATDEVWVGIDTLHPQTDAGMDQIQTCFDNLMTLDGSGSSSGSNYNFEWTTATGNIVNGATALISQVNAPGMYQLLITNNTNGCTTSDITMITLDEDLMDADVGADQILCEDSFQLAANLPNNNSGLWSYTGAAQIDDPLSNDAFLSGLSGGINEFVWTLSTVDCPNYSSDTIVLTVENLPIAQEDLFTIAFGENPAILPVTDNDGILTVSDFSIEITADPAVGSLTQIVENYLRYEYPEAYFGMVEFEYSLCNNFCLNLCDTTSVLLNILDQARIDTTVQIPNGITPNGDGLNEEFIIPILENNPEDFPENELIIFNRWGNTVYQSKPYLNNWKGTNDSGKELPQGTYYFVLRLDLAKGEIIKGEVTVLR